MYMDFCICLIYFLWGFDVFFYVFLCFFFYVLGVRIHVRSWACTSFRCSLTHPRRTPLRLHARAFAPGLGAATKLAFQHGGLELGMGVQDANTMLWNRMVRTIRERATWARERRCWAPCNT